MHNIMDDTSRYILENIGLTFENIDNLEGQFIERSFFINNKKYLEIQEKLIELKKVFSSSSLTCLHTNALTKQKFPLLNLVRQILNVYYFEMKPIRKSDGYTKEGIKKYKRYFNIVKIKNN
jgi:hypothetical protein